MWFNRYCADELSQLFDSSMCSRSVLISVCMLLGQCDSVVIYTFNALRRMSPAMHNRTALIPTIGRGCHPQHFGRLWERFAAVFIPLRLQWALCGGGVCLFQHGTYSVVPHTITKLSPTIGRACHSQNFGRFSASYCCHVFPLRPTCAQC